MSSAADGYRIDPAGLGWIDKTNVKVIEVVVEKLAHGLECRRAHTSSTRILALQPNLRGVIAYYQDHQQALDAEIDQQLEEVDRQTAEQQDSPFRRRLHQSGIRL